MNPKFQQRHYEIFAAFCQNIAVDEEDFTYPSIHLDDLQQRLATLFREDNPRFDSSRFLRACELGTNIRSRK